MAELVYAFDLKSNGEIHMGSSPIPGTSKTGFKAGFVFCMAWKTFAQIGAPCYNDERKGGRVV